MAEKDKKQDGLTDFEGLRVAAVGVEMPNAAGGLQEAMKFEPIEWHHGDEGYVVLHYTTQKVRFDPMIKDAVEPLRRVHVLHVDEAAPIDGKLVRAQMAKFRERIEKAKEAAKGVQRIPGVDPEENPEDPDNVTDLPIAPGEGDPDESQA